MNVERNYCRFDFSMNRMQRLQQIRDDILDEVDLRFGRSLSVHSERADGINLSDHAAESQIKQLRFSQRPNDLHDRARITFPADVEACCRDSSQFAFNTVARLKEGLRVIIH